ncbi:MAG: DUF2461 domain-containing protein [Cyclobacteriaceae bacterium]|nr:DUF2461 domain-containing protein [Cyclobacteriaceae bacterium]
MTNTLRPVYNFLSSLKNNNDREWFHDHKELYEESFHIMIDFADDVLNELRKHDDIETISGKKSLYRIYRDVRFSKDKKPYKISWSGSFKRASKALRGGYYYHIEPGNTFIAGGFFGPNPDDLKHIRKHIDIDETPLRSTLESKSIRSYFGLMQGEQVKTAPRGYEKDNSSIDLLRYKQFILKHDFSDKEAMQNDFSKNMSLHLQHFRPFFDVMSEILTTDFNGISLI